MELTGLINNSTKLSDYITLLKAMGEDFTVTRTGYTAHIQSSMFNIKLFVKERPGHFFGAKNKIKKDAKAKPELLARLMHEARPVYFNIYNLIPATERQVYAFDISAAYPNLLFTEGIITKETHAYIMGIPKKDRLPAIGAIASKKMEFIYEGGEMADLKVTREPLSDLFFYLVGRTNNIINSIACNWDRNKLFSWVDCLYFDVTEFDMGDRARLMKAVFSDFALNKLDCKLEVLKNFNVTEFARHYKLEYSKGPGATQMSVPKEFNFEIQEFHEALFGEI